jgi:hypothetical protein
MLSANRENEPGIQYLPVLLRVENAGPHDGRLCSSQSSAHAVMKNGKSDAWYGDDFCRRELSPFPCFDLPAARTLYKSISNRVTTGIPINQNVYTVIYRLYSPTSCYRYAGVTLLRLSAWFLPTSSVTRLHAASGRGVKGVLPSQSDHQLSIFHSLTRAAPVPLGVFPVVFLESSNPSPWRPLCCLV